MLEGVGKLNLFCDMWGGGDDTKRTCLIAVFLAAEVWLRFCQYREWPLQLVRMSDPDADPEEHLEERRRIAMNFKRTPFCCTNTPFGSKVRSLFTSPKETLEQSVDRMAQDTHWMDTMDTLAERYRVTNMHIERLLAIIRRSTAGSGGAPLIEKSRVAGFIASILAVCCPGGRSGRMKRARAALMKAGLRLRRAKQPRQATKPSGGFALFSASEEKSRRAAGIKLKDCGGRKRRYQSLGSVWRGKTRDEQDTYTARAKAKWSQRQVPAVPAQCPVVQTSRQG